MHTKNGKTLRVYGDKVYSKSGSVVGRIKGSKVYGTDGRYVASVVGDRLVYRSTQANSINSPFVSAPRAASASVNRASSAIWGDEPNIPD